MTDAFRWRLAIGAIIVAGGYAAWLIIPLVMASDLSPSIKSGLAAFLGATPLLTKLIAVALLGRPTINFLRKHSFKLSGDQCAAVISPYCSRQIGDARDVRFRVTLRTLRRAEKMSQSANGGTS